MRAEAGNGATGTHVLLHLDGLKVAGREGAILRIATNKNGTQRGIDDFIVLPNSAAPKDHDHTFNQRFVLPADLAAEVEAAKGELPITISRVTKDGATQRTGIRLKKVYITVE